MRIVLPHLFFALAMGLSLAPEAAETLGMTEDLRIASVKADRVDARVFQRITLSVDLRATFANPFRSEEVSLDATITAQDGTVRTVPGFLYQPWKRSLQEDKEVLEPTGPPQWQVRFAFDAPGEYSIVVEARDRSGKVKAAPLTVKVSKGDAPGMVRRVADDQRYFRTDRGERLFLVGANVCWGSARGTFNYDDWLPRYAENGCNFFRVWLAPEWFTFALNTRASGYDGIELKNAWRLDYVLQQADALGMRAMLCIDSFNILRSKKKRYGGWEESPYIESNGGPIRTPLEYFSDDTVRQAYRDRLRYIVARYGAFSSVFAWEFWNEVDIIDDYDSELVTSWHRDMARHLRSIDPWNHLIGTSHANPKGDPRLDALPELDFVQSHHYGAKDIAQTLYDDRRNKAAAQNRPHFHGEFGISHSGKTTAEFDSIGIWLHNGLYSSVGQEHAGTPMTWWWDSYIHPFNHYPAYGAFTRWIEGFPFSSAANPVDWSIRYSNPGRYRKPSDDILKGIGGTWNPAPHNAPVTVRVSEEGEVSHDTVFSTLLHGLVNHPDLHNPVTFELDVPEKATFGVSVEGVSGHGGARLEISLDGKKILEKDFADSDPGTDTLTDYDGVYEIRIPKGRHTVFVENTGKDWFFVNYRIPWLKAAPPLRVWGLADSDRALIWVQNKEYTWQNVRHSEGQIQAVKGAQLVLNGFDSGTWTVETWDTVEGKVLESKTITVKEGQPLKIELPKITWDAAYRMRRGE